MMISDDIFMFQLKKDTMYIYGMSFKDYGMKVQYSTVQYSTV